MNKYAIEHDTLTGIGDAIREMREYDTALTPLQMPDEIRAIIHPAPNRTEQENLIPATCTEEGSYEEVVYCGTCSHEISRKTVVIPTTGEHTPGKAVRENYEPATCSEMGGYDMVTRCTACGEIISTRHWTISRTPHELGDIVKENEVPATCTSDGSYDEVIYCKNCGGEMQRKTRTTKKLDHTPGEPVTEGDEIVTYCTVCGGEISRVPAEE